MTDAYKLNTRIFPLGSGSVSEGGYFKAFQEIALLADPAVGFTFKGWQQDNMIIQSNAIFNFTIVESTTLTAIFEPMPTSIKGEALERLEISIYPNPASNHVWIKSAVNTPLKQLHVISLDGKILKTVNLQGQMLSEGIELDISQLQSGFFMLLFQGDNQQFTQKFVKI